VSRIEWTGTTWNPVRGCSRVSEGCRHCYAERQAIRQSGPGKLYEGLVESHAGGPRWTGKLVLDQERLAEPSSWRKPRLVFANSMSDLFHEALPDQDVWDVLRAIAGSSRHTFQVLTKRAVRAKKLIAFPPAGIPYPIPNLWLGVSVESSDEAARLLHLSFVQAAAVRFVSVEPLLGPVELGEALEWLDWVIVGGESGPGARPCDIAWIRALVAECKAAGVPVFVKQLGSYPEIREWTQADLASGFTLWHGNRRIRLADDKGGDPAEWPEDLRVREMPKAFAGELVSGGGPL
jgi:protein gp37